MSKKNVGFTLVELLVVIAIIGVLVGLLVPAVNYAREAARKSQCLNRVRGLSQAMLQHESAKQNFPGRINFVRNNQGQQVPVSWATKILPYIEQGNVWDLVVNSNSGDQSLYAGIELDLMTCPSDPGDGSQIPGRLSYVMNTGAWDDDFGVRIQEVFNPSGRANDIRANGIGHVNRNNQFDQKVDLGFLGKNDGAGSTILLSENINAVNWANLDEALHGLVWNYNPENVWIDENAQPASGRMYRINQAADRLTDKQLLDMSNDSITSNKPRGLLNSFARPSSNHAGGVNVAYCDGHASFLSEEIDPNIYGQLLSTARSQARHPRMGNSWRQTPVPSQLNTTLDGKY